MGNSRRLKVVVLLLIAEIFLGINLGVVAGQKMHAIGQSEALPSLEDKMDQIAQKPTKTEPVQSLEVASEVLWGGEGIMPFGMMNLLAFLLVGFFLAIVAMSPDVSEERIRLLLMNRGGVFQVVTEPPEASPAEETNQSTAAAS